MPADKQKQKLINSICNLFFLFFCIIQQIFRPVMLKVLHDDNNYVTFKLEL